MAKIMQSGRARAMTSSGMFEVRLQDFRDVRGVYDGVASIEMFEAVGERFWPVYFNAICDHVKPGRRATLQVITLQGRRWQTYRRGVDFIQKYIFPGGLVPSRAALLAAIGRADMRVVHSIAFGDSYSRTLRRWHAAFTENWPRIAEIGFDTRFRRMWEFSLTSCAASFASGNCDVTQLTVKRAA